MADEHSRYEEKVYHIPDNFSGEVDIPFIHFRVNIRKLLEGIALSILPLLYSMSLPLETTMKFGVTIGVSVPMIVFGCIGISGDPISVFVKNYFLYLGKRDTMLYNPKIKNELRATDEELINSNAAAISTFISESMNAEDKGYDPTENVVFLSDAELSNVVFEDDKIGVKKKVDASNTTVNKNKQAYSKKKRDIFDSDLLNSESKRGER